MKSIWSKIPAWIRAIIFNLILLFPASFLIQNIIRQTLPNTSWGWGIVPVVFILGTYWLLTKKLSPFNGKDDIWQSLSFNIKDGNNWLKFLGLSLFILCIMQLSLIVFSSENNRSLDAILSFRALPAPIAIPILLGLALMAGILEEVTYRGYMQNTTSKAYPKWLSFLIVGILFFLAHRLPFELFVPYMMASVAFSLVADQQRSLGVVILAHVVSDFVIFIGLYYDFINITNPSVFAIVLSIIGLVAGTFLLIRDANWGELGLLRPKKRVRI